MTMYRQYDLMDNDVDIARSLDIIAEEMTSLDEKTKLPFIIEWEKEDNEDIADSTIVTTRSALRSWVELHGLKTKLFNIARTLIKYGDCFFQKSSDTRKWKYLDPMRVVGIGIDDDGDIVNYHVKKFGMISGTAVGIRSEEIEIVPAMAIVHFTLGDDMGDSVPFGQSILRPVFRVYRQLSMLEDATLIYKIVRAPERRVFYIDVGGMNQQRVRQYLENIKNEARQKRVPNGNTQGMDVVDGQYNPASMQEDYYFPVTSGGRSSRVESLPGGSEDFGSTLLRTFQQKLFRGLRIPSSYMSGQDANGAGTPGGNVNDGKVGIAFIEELRFAKFVQRLQYQLNSVLDNEFKIYMRVCGINVDDEVYTIRLPDAANFATYRQAALDTDLIQNFNALQESKILAKRVLLKRYLGLTDDEIQMNEVLLKQEHNLEESDSMSMLQQMYDPVVYDGRKVKQKTSKPGATPAPEAGAEDGGMDGLGDMGGMGDTGSPEGDNAPLDVGSGMEEPEQPAEEPAQ
jgi:hypothetical protein